MHPIIDEAKANRAAFLKPYREKFAAASSRKEKAEIIAELVEIEPDHLSEPWILAETISWLRDFRECQDHIESTFIKAPKRRDPTEDQKRDSDFGGFIVWHVDKLRREGYSIKSAIGKLLDRIPEGAADYYKWDLKTLDQKDLVENIRKFYSKWKKRLSKKTLPHPYYGHNVIVDEKGETHITSGF